MSGKQEEQLARAVLRKNLRTWKARGGRKASRGRKSSAKGVYSTNSVKSVFPDSKHVVFNYAQDFTMTATTGSNSSHVFRCNSLYDPDYTATGHKPRYFDTLCGADNGTAPYQSYLVKAAKLTAYVRSNSSSWMAVSLTMHRDSAAGPSNINEARERGDTVIKMLPPLGTGTGAVRISMYRRMKDILAIKDIEDYGGARSSYNANPVSQVYATIVCWNMDSASGESFHIQPTLVQYSKLFTKNDVADS